MINSDKKNQNQIPSFWPIDLIWATSMSSKTAAPKMFSFIFNLKNVVETLGDTRHFSVEITLSKYFPWVIVVDRLGHMCNFFYQKAFNKLFITSE